MGSSQSAPGRNGPHDSLTITPENLKEAIDWVLRVSGKDGGGGDGDAFGNLSKAVGKLLDEAKINGRIKLSKEFEDYKLLPKNNKTLLPSSDGIIFDLLHRLSNSLSRFIGYDEYGNGTITGTGIAVGRKGAASRGDASEPWKTVKEKNKANGKVGYTLAYDPEHAKWYNWNHESVDAQNCAKIFMIAVTIIFEKLTWLYWECRHPNQWSKERFDVPTSGRLSAFLVREGFDLNGLCVFYVPKPKAICKGNQESACIKRLEQNQVCYLKSDNKPSKTCDPKYIEGRVINGILAYAFEEFSRVMAQPPESTLPSTWRTPNSYKDFVKELLDRAKKSSDKFNEIKGKKYCEKYCKNTTNCTSNCETLRRSDAYSTFLEYPITKVYILAANYREYTDKGYRSTILRTLSGMTVGAGIGTAAYLTKAFGFGPIIAGFFT
ncbi:variant erythrocyte surface antigen-1 family protein [Babesia caballi]|uniref:Variant erythrocyte surface antigen-1 family protein n=1 Tax=Babesia caballi TaxID=5871 RepID=A0AAV4LTD7_BABCB|nr:variant erythrocyte surface antigen-1 family protein [Babesia caballi]